MAAARWVKSILEEGKVGQDRSQVQSLTLSRWLVVGTASARLGAIFRGLYIGGVLWALPKWTRLTAVQADGPTMIAGTISDTLLTAAGLWLEKAYQLPTNGENSSPPNGEMGINSVRREL